ncbi:MAG: lipocalin-like domain-containing protein, partial [Thermoanaerobaculia bacterium]
MRTPRSLVLALLVFIAAAGALTTLAVVLERRAKAGSDLEGNPAGTSELDVTAALAGFAADDSRFLRARAPRSFEFPADHGAHDGFRTEWWYVTGNLLAADGRAFGVQLTFFRNALAPPAPEAASSRTRS